MNLPMNQLTLHGKKSHLQTEILAQANLTHKCVCHKEYQQKLFKKTSEHTDGSVLILSPPEK